MYKKVRNLVSQKASKAQKDREETIKQNKNKQIETNKSTPEQEPNILEADVSARKKETTSQTNFEAVSTVIPTQANPKGKQLDEISF